MSTRDIWDEEKTSEKENVVVSKKETTSEKETTKEKESPKEAAKKPIVKSDRTESTALTVERGVVRKSAPHTESAPDLDALKKSMSEQNAEALKVMQQSQASMISMSKAVVALADQWTAANEEAMKRKEESAQARADLLYVFTSLREVVTRFNGTHPALQAPASKPIATKSEPKAAAEKADKADKTVEKVLLNADGKPRGKPGPKPGYKRDPTKTAAKKPARKTKRNEKSDDESEESDDSSDESDSDAKKPKKTAAKPPAKKQKKDDDDDDSNKPKPTPKKSTKKEDDDAEMSDADSAKSKDE